VGGGGDKNWEGENGASIFLEKKKEWCFQENRSGKGQIKVSCASRLGRPSRDAPRKGESGMGIRRERTDLKLHWTDNSEKSGIGRVVGEHLY